MADLTANGIVPFSQFVDSLHEARAAHFLNVPNSALEDEVSFAEMRSYLERYYDGAEAIHSFVDEGDSIFDCIPIEKQFSRRGKTDRIPTAPELPGLSDRSESEARMPIRSITQWRLGLVDRFGNRAQAPEGTIPVRRMTLANLARFRSLREFFQKSPGQGPGQGGDFAPPGTSRPPALLATNRRYAHAVQTVSNLGGGGFLNVWAPTIGPDHLYSNAQHWYAGGTGGGLQTAEMGWHVYPKLYGHTKPVLFIYWTADNYVSTGCLNLGCSAFVQTNPKWILGGSLSPVSTSGGTQFGIRLHFWLTSGGWWLYAGGDSVGYYPTSIYGTGTLATSAETLDYGGEAAGGTSWPPMGGGAFASAGFRYAASHSELIYFSVRGGSADPFLRTLEPSPSCYTAQLAKYAPPWNVTVWFGGPGGSAC